ncbi:uncharacterized protein Z518_04972 [Rhinocladiella mackenziei CBS 650.93]|uniref:Rhinocladiella mackenziei CBS 650.93 unplaced genomic scaffold supercont1.3, whole genome shotgun sequence n=1 Tax=Rhinocladiella mackenziei CBS 650.93 TaxID=1442369 RepID=A0A0D2IV16_9EURO|nr:uncharacterized protein Z518_04972 [Rhinocladiella mackenziei CBS 650.93]KIX06996.1 hypothetical protein Z518_04972 [Rhinocladiella mackenziei CBS 650.93]
MAPIAAVLCGKQPPLAQFMIKNLAQKIELVMVCTSVDSAVSEIPALLKGESVTPSSGLGSNAEGAGRSDVSLIIVGGGYSPADLEAIRSAVDAVKPLAFFVADTSKSPPGATGPPPPDVIKKRIMDCIEGQEKGEGEFAPGVYMY